MTIEIDLIGKKQPLLTNTLFEEGKVKFIQIKQDFIREEHEKRQCKYVDTHEV